MNEPFLQMMLESLGKEKPVIVPKEKVPVTEVPEPKPAKQELVPVQLMDSDMKDSFFLVGNNDLKNFIKRFQNNEYSYKVGGVFGSDAKLFNDGKPFWVEAFTTMAKPGKKSKTAYFLDATNPKDTIDEAAERLRVDYPDLIIGF